jgi:hypothetical protein
MGPEVKIDLKSSFSPGTQLSPGASGWSGLDDAVYGARPNALLRVVVADAFHTRRGVDDVDGVAL